MLWIFKLYMIYIIYIHPELGLWDRERRSGDGAPWRSKGAIVLVSSC